jgi:hypothetical protein
VERFHGRSFLEDREDEAVRRKYSNWIKKHAGGNVAGLCGEFTILIHATFPELVMIEGAVTRADGVPDGHCWTLDPVTGDIVDPTASQYDVGFRYVGGKPWLMVDPKLFRLAVKMAEEICGEPLLPADTFVAGEVETLLQVCVLEVKEAGWVKARNKKRRRKPVYKGR